MITKKQILENVSKFVQITKADLKELSTQKLNELVDYYKGLLIDNVPTTLGLPMNVINTLSIEKLEALINDSIKNKEERKKKEETKVFKMNKRLPAMIDTINYLVSMGLFNVAISEVLKVMYCYYAKQYFNMGICGDDVTRNIDDYKTLYDNGLIECINGRTSEPIQQLEKNSGYLTQYLYSTSKSGSAQYSTQHIENSGYYNGYIATRNGANIEISKRK